MDSTAINVAMEVGALDLLCIIPRDEIEKYVLVPVLEKCQSGKYFGNWH
jgi:hypothetical protein